MRKRRARVVWLPVDTNNRVGAAPGPQTNKLGSGHFFTAITGPALSVDADTALIPLVRDDQSTQLSSQTPESSLADLENSSYRLRRVVGKIVVICGQNIAAAPEDPTLYQVTAGIMVLRTDLTGTNAAQLPTQYAVDAIVNTADPWIWRRSWVICDQEGAAAINSNTRGPRSNIEGYGGGNNDASHLDQKTARVVGPEERLFFVVSARGLDGNAQAPNPGLILVVGDLRVLASMRSSVGNRGNSSR